MPAGLKRYYGGGDLHYITCSCYQTKRWLDTALRRNLFLKILEEVRLEQRFVVLGYVVLGYVALTVIALAATYGAALNRMHDVTERLVR